jgi:hypothetical protein
MMEFIQALIVGGAWCVGLHVVVKNVLIETLDIYDFGTWYDDLSRAQKLLLKPVFLCPYCMASVHGTIIFFTMLYPSFGLLMWIPYCICLCGVNYFVTQFFVE